MGGRGARSAIARDGAGSSGKISALRSEIRAAARKFAGSTVRNNDSGFDIKITNRGIKEATSGYRREEELKAIERLPSMIARARYVGSQPEMKNNPGVKRYHIFETNSQINRKRYTFTIKVRELQDGKYFYDSYTKK